MTDFLIYAIRVLIIYIFTFLAARTLSRKAIAEMTSYEIAGIILLSTVASETLATRVISHSVFGVGLISLLIYTTSRLSLIDKLTPILEHTPTIVLQNGQIDMSALKKAGLSMNQFMGLLRQKGFDKINDVEFAIFEPQGTLSAFPKSQYRPLEPRDLMIPTTYEGLTLPLIIDGAIIERNLHHVKLDQSWLMKELQKQGIMDYQKEITLAELDTQGNLILSKKQEN